MTTLYEIFNLSEDDAILLAEDADILEDNVIQMSRIDILIRLSVSFKSDLPLFDQRIVDNYFFEEYMRKYPFTEAVCKLYSADFASDMIKNGTCRFSQVDD